MPHSPSTTCLFCETPMVGVHCKQICPNCGYREDCSDLFPECAYEPPAHEQEQKGEASDAVPGNSRGQSA